MKNETRNQEIIAQVNQGLFDKTYKGIEILVGHKLITFREFDRSSRGGYNATRPVFYAKIGMQEIVADNPQDVVKFAKRAIDDDAQNVPF